MNIWTSTEKGDDKVIAFVNDTIYKANPPEREIDACIFDLKTQNIVSKYFFGIPLHYISTITLQEGKKYIEIKFRGDTEYLKIKNDTLRNEVFEFFKTNIPGAQYTLEKPSKLKAAKKPLIAMVVVTAMFFWALYLAIGKENGEQYEVTGDHYNSLAGIALALASLGVKKVILIFGSLILIAVFAFIKKYKEYIVKLTLIIKR